MKKFFLIAFLLLFFNNVFALEVDEPDNFEQINGKLKNNIELPNKLAIFEKMNNTFISAYFSEDDDLIFVEYDEDLKEQRLSSLKINAKEYLNYYKFDGENVLLIFVGRDGGNYAKSISFNFRRGIVNDAELVFILLSPSDYNPDDWNEDLPYKVKLNKNETIMKDYDSNPFSIRIRLSPYYIIDNSQNGTIMMYNFLESNNGNFDVFYSIIDKNGRYIKSERKTLFEKAKDKFRYINGFYAEISNNNEPIFFVDHVDNKERKLTAFLFLNELKIISTSIPGEINGSTDFELKSFKFDKTSNKRFGLICEEDKKGSIGKTEIFSYKDYYQTYGIIIFDLNIGNVTLNCDFIFFNSEEIEKFTKDNELTANMISDIRYQDNWFYLILENNDFYNSTDKLSKYQKYIPTSELREALFLKIDKDMKINMTYYMKDREINRDITCETKSKFFSELSFKYSLKFDSFDNNSFSFFYHDNSDDDIFGYRTINSIDGTIIKDTKLFESDEQLFLNPMRIYKDKNNVIMNVSNECDSHIVKFTF